MFGRLFGFADDGSTAVATAPLLKKVKATSKQLTIRGMRSSFQPPFYTLATSDTFGNRHRRRETSADDSDHRPDANAGPTTDDQAEQEMQRERNRAVQSEQPTEQQADQKTNADRSRQVAIERSIADNRTQDAEGGGRKVMFVARGP